MLILSLRRKKENLKRMLKNCVFYCWVVLVKKKRKRVALSNKKWKWGLMKVIFDNKGEGNIMREKRATDQREVSPKSHSAPGAEGSHQLLSSETSWIALGCASSAGTSYPLWLVFLLYTTCQSLLSFSWASGNMGMTWAMVSVSDIRVYWSSLSHHNLCPLTTLHFVLCSSSFPYLILQLLLWTDHCFCSFTTPLDLHGLSLSEFSPWEILVLASSVFLS